MKNITITHIIGELTSCLERGWAEGDAQYITRLIKQFENGGRTIPAYPTKKMLDAGDSWYYRNGAASSDVPLGCYLAMSDAAPKPEEAK